MIRDLRILERTGDLIVIREERRSGIGEILVAVIVLLLFVYAEGLAGGDVRAGVTVGIALVLLCLSFVRGRIESTFTVRRNRSLQIRRRFRNRSREGEYRLAEIVRFSVRKEGIAVRGLTFELASGERKRMTLFSHRGSSLELAAGMLNEFIH